MRCLSSSQAGPKRAKTTHSGALREFLLEGRSQAAPRRKSRLTGRSQTHASEALRSSGRSHNAPGRRCARAASVTPHPGGVFGVLRSSGRSGGPATGICLPPYPSRPRAVIIPPLVALLLKIQMFKNFKECLRYYSPGMGLVLVWPWSGPGPGPDAETLAAAAGGCPHCSRILSPPGLVLQTLRAIRRSQIGGLEAQRPRGLRGKQAKRPSGADLGAS